MNRKRADRWHEKKKKWFLSHDTKLPPVIAIVGIRSRSKFIYDAQGKITAERNRLGEYTWEEDEEFLRNSVSALQHRRSVDQNPSIQNRLYAIWSDPATPIPELHRTPLMLQNRERYGYHVLRDDTELGWEVLRNRLRMLGVRHIIVAGEACYVYPKEENKETSSHPSGAFAPMGGCAGLAYEEMSQDPTFRVTISPWVFPSGRWEIRKVIKDIKTKLNTMD